ncbi:MAG: tetratricopeptide repeat protein [Kiritimatiellia bacterium]|jgi:tetratricopeptide (TPR) repeat protein|nr:tetratricopeptide repeat protein [Kiritimatiellia bacterium]MDP6631233.1 tetratricopeptide repeat protein [Kiritimatiellia bacterium]MDP6809564.1 tetratricopeptide repeat protein [Kiritimatiellia bacterium]MDP7023585.1 tetratricopeptide repeat protein [Kiritimatiellia bacterium]
MRQRTIWLTKLFLAGVIIAAAPARGTDDLTGGPSPEIRAEIQYAEALQKLGMPDYMEIVLDRLIKKHPEAKPLIKVLRLQSMISRGKFAEVLEIIAREPNQNSQDAWAMRLSLADGYYAWGKYPQAEEIYVSFFKAFPKPPAGLNDFFINSAYKYAQMQLVLGKDEEAITAYKNVLKAKVEEHIKRQVMSETAELMLKVAQAKPAKDRAALLKEIDELATDILWVQDIWFGKAIVIMAQAKALQGDIPAAMKLVKDYTPQLKQIHDILVEQELESLSPMANCRYMLGSIMWKEAQKLIEEGGDKAKIIDLLAGKAKPKGGRESGAYKHFVNVFIGYPSSKWAADAGEQVDRIKAVLEGYGAEINTPVTPEKMDEVRRYQFLGARALFNQNQFANAVDAYVKVLNRFPEGETSVAALGELSRCYVETEDDLMVDTTVRYLSERFGGDHALQGKAGDQVLRVGGTYGERGLDERKEAVYEIYFDNFKQHPMAAALVYQHGNRHYREERYAAALPYYQRIVEDYSDSPSYLSTLKQITYCQLKMEDVKGELQALNVYAKALSKERRPGHEYLRTQFRMASAYQRVGGKYLASAIKRYNAVIKLVEAKDPKYEPTTEDAEKNADVMQGCLFFKAVCYTQLKSEDAAKTKAYQLAAIKTLQQLIDTFPTSRYAAPALSQIGTLWTILEKPDEAQEALKRLQSEYPETPEAQNALFMLGKSLLDLGMRKRAIDVFRDMFSGDGKYSNSQILTAGTELLKAGEYDISLQAFDQVLAATEERVYVEKAMMGKGQVMVERKEYKKASDVLQNMLDKYPNSGMTVEASLQLSRCYAQLAQDEADDDKRLDFFNRAVLAMTKARKYDKSAGFRARSDVVIANLILLKAAAETEFGDESKAKTYHGQAISTLQALMMLGDANDKDARPHIEDAFATCLPLLIEAEHWQEAMDDSDSYLETFGNGGRYASEVRRIRSKAKTKLAVSGAEVGATDGAAEEIEEEEGDDLIESPAEPEAGAADEKPEAEAAAAN